MVDQKKSIWEEKILWCEIRKTNMCSVNDEEESSEMKNLIDLCYGRKSAIVFANSLEHFNIHFAEAGFRLSINMGAA